MNARWLAVLVLAASSMGCRHPCEAVSVQAIALDDTCAEAFQTLKDERLVKACGVAYTMVREALSSGSCSPYVGKR